MVTNVTHLCAPTPSRGRTTVPSGARSDPVYLLTGPTSLVSDKGRIRLVIPWPTLPIGTSNLTTPEFWSDGLSLLRHSRRQDWSGTQVGSEATATNELRHAKDSF
jgi:hypothetical protein